MPERKMRQEKDSLGTRELPDDVLWGIQTARAVENFPISGLRLPAEFIRAYAGIKRSAARVNRKLGLLPDRLAKVIVAAADEVLAGQHHDQFVVDVYQAGAGTSYNMNVNEVLANRGLDLLRTPRGSYGVLSPNDHVNLGQSTNDTFPAAIRITALFNHAPLVEALRGLESAFSVKSMEFDSILKSARTHLQDAVPLRLGQEFHAWATLTGDCRRRLEQASEDLHRLNLGATAAGTGMGAHPDYRKLVAHELTRLFGIKFHPAEDLPAVTQSMGDLLWYSAALRQTAVELDRIASDLRLLASGPRTGLAEIRLPATQPGSSIMPGKVNPSIPEMFNQVCKQVVGLDQTVLSAASAGQLDLNVMTPVLAYNLLLAQTILTRALEVLTNRCIVGIEADADRCQKYFETSLGLVTVLSPAIGYLAAAQIAKESLATGQTIRELILARKLLTPEELERVLDVYSLTEPDLQERLR